MPAAGVAAGVLATRAGWPKARRVPLVIGTLTLVPAPVTLILVLDEPPDDKPWEFAAFVVANAGRVVGLIGVMVVVSLLASSAVTAWVAAAGADRRSS